MSNFKLQNAKEAEERISQVIMRAAVDELTQDWVSLGFEIKRIREAEKSGLLMLEALEKIVECSIEGNRDYLQRIAQAAIDAAEGEKVCVK